MPPPFSTGHELPDGYQPRPPLSVLLLSGEDAIQATVLPRLESAGADIDRIHLFQGQAKPGERPWPIFPEQCSLLKEAVAANKTRIVIIDPLTAFGGLRGRLETGPLRGKQKWVWHLKDHAERCEELVQTRSVRQAVQERDEFLAWLHGNVRSLTTENTESTELKNEDS